MTEEVVYVVPAAERRGARMIGGLFVVLAIWFGWLLREELDVAVVAMLIAFLGAGAYFLYYASRGAKGHTVVMNQQGLRIGSGRLIAFSEIDQLRARSHRVDLLGRGETLGSLAFELDDLWGALANILGRIDFRLEPPSRVIAAPRQALELTATAVMLLLLLAGSMVLIVRGSWLGYLGVPLALYLAYDQFFKIVRRIEFGETEMRVRYAIGSRSVPRAAIRFFQIVVLGKELYAAAFLAEPEIVRLQVPGVDPFVVLATARRNYGV